MSITEVQGNPTKAISNKVIVAPRVKAPLVMAGRAMDAQTEPITDKRVGGGPIHLKKKGLTAHRSRYINMRSRQAGANCCDSGRQAE